MSEEKKQNNNQGGHRPRHYYHNKNKNKNQQNNNNNNIEKKESAPAVDTAPKAAPAAPKKPEEAAAKNQSSDNNNKRRNHKPHQRHDKNQNRESEHIAVSDRTSVMDTPFDVDPIFSPFISSRTKEKSPSKTYSDTADITPLSDEELFGTSHLIHKSEALEDNTTEIVGVCFKAGGKIYYFDPDGIKVTKGSFAIVDTARGLEFGEVCIANKKISGKNIVQPLRKMVRIATKEDIEHHESNKARERDAIKICTEKVAAHKLDMKLVEAQYSFDNTKLLFYFTSPGRVDFRELVRDLASVFKTRIELRQIGIRDEAKMLGGIGMCGRPLCCSRYLSNFAQVSIKMAKEQGLSLNANKISGNCGRLMCCLNFENQIYLDEIKVTPMPGSIVKVDGTRGVVTDANPLTGMLKVHLDGSPEGEKTSVHRDTVTVLSRKTPEVSAENDSKDEIPEA